MTMAVKIDPKHTFPKEINETPNFDHAMPKGFHPGDFRVPIGRG